MRDAFLAERDAHDLRDADFVCDARLRRVWEPIASPITAQLHHRVLLTNHFLCRCGKAGRLPRIKDELLTYREKLPPESYGYFRELLAQKSQK